jgi:uncharacterized protein with PIN domain
LIREMAAKYGQATLRFYEELNDFLRKDRRKLPFQVRFYPGDTVKALIESHGVPHPEVDLILVNGRSVSFRYRVRDGDYVSVYPVFESLEIGSVTRVRPAALRRTRFVLDVHLGRLAKLLRMLGFDSLYSNSYDDAELSRLSGQQGRIVLTRDRELLKRSAVSHGYCLRSDHPMDQLLEVLKRFDLGEKVRPFTRCLRCNRLLQDVDPEVATASVPEYVARTYDRYKSCPGCGRLYWRGSHWEHMRRLLEASL